MKIEVPYRWPEREDYNVIRRDSGIFRSLILFFLNVVVSTGIYSGTGLVSVQPPSTTRVCPVICLASSEIRNITAWAISDGVDT